MKTNINASAIWLRNIKDHAEVLVEIDGEWKVAIREYIGTESPPFSHIAEGNGQDNWAKDPLTLIKDIK